MGVRRGDLRVDLLLASTAQELSHGGAQHLGARLGRRLGDFIERSHTADVELERNLSDPGHVSTIHNVSGGRDDDGGDSGPRLARWTDLPRGRP